MILKIAKEKKKKQPTNETTINNEATTETATNSKMKYAIRRQRFKFLSNHVYECCVAKKIK